MRFKSTKYTQTTKVNVFEIIRFGIVGSIATIIHYGTYLLLLTILPDWFSYSLGYGVSFLLNFVLSNYYTFKTRPTIKKGMGFCLSHMVNFILHICLLEFFLFLKIPEKLAPIPVFTIAIPINFILVRFFLKK